MSATLDESFFADPLALARIASHLAQIAAGVDELSAIVVGCTKGSFGPRGDFEIVPECFYWEIRPWFNGGKWFYEGVSGGDGDDLEELDGTPGKTMEWGGPSAGQSSLIHSIDLFLSVDHSPRPSPTASTSLAPTASSASMDPSSPLPPRPTRSMTVQKSPEPAASDSTFMLRAALYMPSHHRAFLYHLSALHLPTPSTPSPIPSVRTLALTHPAQLREAYDGAVRAMKAFRDVHMRLVTVFIISQARKPPGVGSVFWKGWEEKRVEGEEERRREKEREGLKKETLMGTGGTALVTFLKECRERTKEALLDGAA